MINLAGLQLQDASGAKTIGDWSLEQEQFNKGCTVFALFAVLTIINLWYFVFRVCRLDQKSYHVMMFILLQVCFTSYITEYLLIFLGVPHGAAICVVLSDLYICLDCVVHICFVIKYWILARKIKCVVTK
jgi:hypothetical protein